MSRCRDVVALRTRRICSGRRYRWRQLAARDPIAVGRRLGRAVQGQPHDREEGDSVFGRTRPRRGQEASLALLPWRQSFTLSASAISHRVEVGGLEILRGPVSVRSAESYHVSAERPPTHLCDQTDKFS
jgi:hypothetical protein